MEVRQAGAASVSLYIMIRSKVSDPVGQGLTGLVYNTSGLAIAYTRDGAAATNIPLVTLAAVTTAWASGGFKEISSTLAPGLYRLDVPDLAFATGVAKFRINWTGANSVDDGVECDLVGFNPLTVDKDGYTLSATGNTSVGTAVAANASIAAITTKIDAAKVVVDAVKLKTDNLPSDPADASVVAGLIGGVATQVTTVDGRLDTEIPALTTAVAAVKAKTDNLPSDPADQSLLLAAVNAIEPGAGGGGTSSGPGASLVW